MPPRYAYWTILIDATPTAFRARDREELLPTVHQLRRTNANVELRWFANGRLWDTPEQAQWARRNVPKPAEARGREWRPGGTHKDPRARFKRKPKAKAPRASGSRPPTSGAGARPSSGRPAPPGARPRSPARRPAVSDQRPLPQGTRPLPAGARPRTSGQRPPSWKNRPGGADRRPAGEGGRSKPSGGRPRSADRGPRKRR